MVGDVHGCADELEALLDAVGPDEVLLTGDLFTRGPAPEAVWARVRDSGFRAVLGNHDDRLLAVLDGRRPGDVAGRSVVERLDAADPSWRAWLAERPLHLSLDVTFPCHDGQERPFVLVHAGVHPSGALDQTTRAELLTVRRWPHVPGSEADERPFWWQIYAGSTGVVFGHDAARGLVQVERDGARLVLGLDTGCVYGGKLSAWLLDEDTIVSVPARAAYAPMGPFGAP